VRLKLPTVTVTAQKEPQDKQEVPVSVTAVTEEILNGADVHIVSEAGIFSPNTFFTEASARKLSAARIRGIGSSPANPAITSFIDGVPQLNANSANLELVDVSQIEFVRGPQSALFGRNTLGGLISVASRRPSLSAWTGEVTAPFGNYGQWAVRGSASGPLVKDKLSVGFGFAQVDREGFTVNDITGNDIDSRSAFTGKGQLLWVPDANWQARVVLTAERARDGDYALNDVASLRANPYHAARDFEGYTDRDIFGTTVLVSRVGGPLTFSSTTGFLNWETKDATDLDYTPMPIATRTNEEDAFQFTQEFRVSSGVSSLSDSATFKWQAGLFLFSQNYTQDAVNSYSPFVFAPMAIAQHTPRAALDDFGLGLFGQGTVTFGKRFDVTGGLRFDYEDKSAILENFFEPMIFPGTRIEPEASFSNVSPQASVAYRLQPDKTVYGLVSRGYKAGGFNPASPVGSESYGEERTWLVEGGLKTLWANGRVSTNASVFYIDWEDLQLNVPDPFVPAQFYIANVGGASSKGVEFELAARALPGFDVLASIGYTNAEFGAGAFSSGFDVEGNTIPNTPDYTMTFGGQYTHSFGAATVQARADAVFYGAFEYDDLNTLGQDAYSLVNFRVGVSAGFLLGELSMRNAFDTKYIPFAFPYPNFTASGFVGEMGAPRTLTVSAGVRF
jgi:iron complex outermembrane receptor protein